MLIAAGALVQFVKFMQITTLIILPLLVTAVGFSLYTHYKRKKTKKISPGNPDPVVHLINAQPEIVNYSEMEGDYLEFDHSALVKEYKSKLIYSHARFTALQKDYEQLQDKCNSLLMIIQTHSPQKTKGMKNHENDVTPISTSEGLTQPDATVDDACLKDIIDQKMAQIAFLQDQLDQRIRNYHLKEKQLGQVTQELEEMKQSSGVINDNLAELNASLNEKKALISELRQEVDEKAALLSAKEDANIWLENTLRDTRSQNEMLNAQVADKSDLVQSLQDALEDEQNRSSMLEQKLERNRQVMRRLFSELAICMDAESPVIGLKAAYVNDQAAELAETPV